MVSFFRVKIDLVPIFHVPLHRRLQTLAAAWYTISFLLPVATCLLWITLLFSRLSWVALGYLAWVVYEHRVNRVSSRGGRRWHWFRKCAFWGYMRDYFPVSLVKTAPLDPSHNYILGYHPHGIISCGAFCNFATEATGFSQLYPGIRPTIVTITANFIWPLLREYLLWLGVCDVSKDSLQWILTRQGTGNAVIVVVGGAEESLQAKPGNYNLFLKHRKGFVKMALRTGAHLVPVFSFGEVDLFQQADNPQGSMLRKFQEVFKTLFGFAPPLFHGRGVFNYTFGLIPFRRPIHTVVGSPIPVVQCPDPDQETIDQLHRKYMEQLANIFDQHKTKYGVEESKRLNFI